MVGVQVRSILKIERRIETDKSFCEIVANDGYGIPYMIHPESLQFTVTCRNEMPGAEFAANLELSGNLLMDLMMTESKL